MLKLKSSTWKSSEFLFSISLSGQVFLLALMVGVSAPLAAFAKLTKTDSTVSATAPAKAIEKTTPEEINDENVLFEAYSKIVSGGVPVGYTVVRYGFRPKEKRYYSTYLLKTGQLGSDITESLKAVASQNLEPISYQFTSIVGTDSKVIDAQFKKSKTGKGSKSSKIVMTAKVTTSSTAPKAGPPKTTTIREDLPKGSFLSTFLVYLMMNSKTGIQTDSKYAYTAIAEEDAKVFDGEALVGKQEKFNGIQVYKIFNRFKGSRFVSYVTDRGEVLATAATGLSLETEVVAKPSEATSKFSVSSPILKNLFGDVPMGISNAVSKKLQLEALPPPKTPTNPKQEGIPQNEGIIIKAQSPEAPPEAPLVAPTEHK